MKHTPGPWIVDSQYIITADLSTDIAEVYGRNLFPESKANTYLIAAAPDLLEALKSLLEVCACQNNCPPNDMTCATNKALAAIVKAEGK